MAERQSNFALADGGLSRAEAGETRAAPFADGAEHLLAALARLDLLLALRVCELRAGRLLNENEFRGLYIPDEQADALLGRVDGGATMQELEACAAEARELSARAARAEAEIAARVRASAAAGFDLPLPRLARQFGLTEFETGVLVLAAAPEVDLKYETLYAYAQNDVTKKHLTVDLALRLLCADAGERLRRRDAFADAGVLRRQNLVRLFEDAQERETSLLARFVKLDERIADYLLDKETCDGLLFPFVERLRPARGFDELRLPEELGGELRDAAKAGGGLFFFQGPYGVGKRAAAEAVCVERGLPLLVADLRGALASGEPFALLASLLRREAELAGAALALEHFEALLDDGAEGAPRRRALGRALEGFGLPAFVMSERPWHAPEEWRGTCAFAFDFPLPTFDARRRFWLQALAETGERVSADADLDAVAGKFSLSGGQIRDAARAAAALVSARGRGEIMEDDLHRAARDQSNQALRRLAQKVEPVFGWADIILPPRPAQQLREVFLSVRRRHTVYNTWGFERKLALGRGLNVLFAGESGTGKTMAAQIIARELGLDLFKIDLANVVSKYIGETEKNLGKIFREAQTSNSVLFFDEADAIFGKRSEVKDSHDRYANIEVAYLLQKMEEYEGIVILATNLSKNMDEAFARRMHHSVEFPFPEAPYRERIWRGVFPREAPLAADVDFPFLARQFALAGGNIRNVALAAAFMAAEEGSEISMPQLIRATARELHKTGRLPSRADFRDYYELIRERG